MVQELEAAGGGECCFDLLVSSINFLKEIPLAASASCNEIFLAHKGQVKGSFPKSVGLILSDSF
jgi:hypothetical protein